MGEILKRMAASGERDRGKGGDRKSLSRGATVKLADLGIPKDRASRAIAKHLLLAVARDEKGNIELTVWEKGRAASVVLSADLAKGLARMLTSSD